MMRSIRISETDAKSIKRLAERLAGKIKPQRVGDIERAELDALGALASAIRASDVPTPLEEPDLANLRYAIQEHLEELCDGSWNVDRDVKQRAAIYEAAVTALYGDIWHWINARGER